MGDLPENVIWKWKPDVREYDPEDPRRHDDVAEEYAIELCETAFSGGLIVWAKYSGEWEPNPWMARPVIAKLLSELKYNVTLPEHVHHKWMK